MQDYDWNDLKFALALYRTGTFVSAAKVLRVDETTVARRIASLERRLGLSLFVRTSSGRYEAVSGGLAVIDHAERIELETHSLLGKAERRAGHIVGTARITSIPIIVNRVLVPLLAGFRRANPSLTIELVPDARTPSLSRREADLALRLGRPEEGGLQVKAERIGELIYAVYGPAAALSADQRRLEWIGYDDAHAHLPHARWLAERGAEDGPDFPCLRVADAETALEAVAAGLGRTVLPRIVGDKDLRLQRLDDYAGLPTRELWLLSHGQRDSRSAVAIARAWLAGMVPGQGL